VGEVIRKNDVSNYTVIGIIRDFPANATFEFGYFMSFNLFQELGVSFLGQWGNINVQTLIMTAPNVDIDDLGKTIWSVPNDLNPDQEVCYLWVQPLSEIHFMIWMVVKRRTKEIGVRKVLGASVSGHITLLIRDFTKWVLISNLIAMPIAWFVMNNWD